MRFIVALNNYKFFIYQKKKKKKGKKEKSSNMKKKACLVNVLKTVIEIFSMMFGKTNVCLSTWNVFNVFQCF